MFAEFPKVSTILDKIDEISKLKSDGTAKVKITQQKVNQGLKRIECIYYRRDSDDAFLIIMTGPEVEKGNGYLRVGDNFWMYRRNTRTFQHINRDENIAGSDAKGEDFERRRMTELYKPAVDKNGKEIITEEKLGKIDSYNEKRISYDFIDERNDKHHQNTTGSYIYHCVTEIHKDYDLIIVPVKSYQLDEALHTLIQQAPHANYLLFTLDWDSRGMIDSILGKKQYIIGYAGGGGTFK